MAVANAFHQVIQRADAARCDDRHRDPIGNRPGERKVVTALAAVPVHRGHQQFARSALHHLFGKAQGVDACGSPPAMGKEFPAWRFAGR